MTSRAVVASWSAVQWLLAPGYCKLQLKLVQAHIGAIGQGRWLDVGCGPRHIGATRSPLPAGQLVGVDLAPPLAPRLINGWLPACASADLLPFPDQIFDGVFCFGLLHHLDERQALMALAEMRRVLRPGGVALVFDAVTPRSALRRPLAALLRALDRGRYMRPESALHDLLGEKGFRPGPRMTYAWTGLEGCVGVLRAM